MSDKPTKKKLQYLGYQLTEAQCRYAMANTTSNAEAARWLNVNKDTWRKYARQYIDEATGKDLYQLQTETGLAKRLVLPQSRYRRRGQGAHLFKLTPLEEVFDNKHPRYNLARFKERIIKEGWLPERCCKCGFQERREFDYSIPLRIHWKDNNQRNYRLDNIELMCFNCFYIYVGFSPFGGRETQAKIDEVTGEIVPTKGDWKSIKTQFAATKGPYFKGKT